MGFFEKLKQGLTRTANSIGSVFTASELDDDFYDELEESLILADIGVETATKAVAPHNLTMRPIVIPSSSDVRLKVHARHAEISIATDNETCPIPEGAEFRVRLASRRFFLAVPHNISFYDTLRKKMMWGVDIRS